MQLESRHKENRILICDTNLQVIKLWSIIKFSKCDPFILKNQDKKALYILCKPDFEWTFDHLRETLTIEEKYSIFIIKIWLKTTWTL